MKWLWGYIFRHTSDVEQRRTIHKFYVEHSVRSGLDHGNRLLLWKMPHVCALCISTVANKIGSASFFFVGLNLLFFAKNESRFVLFRFFVCFFCPR